MSTGTGAKAALLVETPKPIAQNESTTEEIPGGRMTFIFLGPEHRATSFTTGFRQNVKFCRNKSQLASFCRVARPTSLHDDTPPVEMQVLVKRKAAG
ncbi:MAG: hypothetical protein WBQ89_26310 [Candidatus Acidiferrum sp.]